MKDLEIKIVSSKLMNWILLKLGFKAMVLSKRKIYTVTGYNKLFQYYAWHIVNKRNFFDKAPRPTKLFRHEFAHIIQSHKYSLAKRVYLIIRDAFKPHDKRQLEIEADLWAEMMRRMTPVEMYNFWYLKTK